MADIFIAYSRRDREFVRVLYDALSARGIKTWIDGQNIPIASNWWQEVEAGIAAASTFMIILSGDSVASRYCQREAEYAARQNKRIIPILRRDDFSPNDLSPAIAALNWLDFRDSDSFDEALRSLVATLAGYGLAPQQVYTQIRRETRLAHYFVELLPGEVGLNMMWIPGGTFLMGSPDDEPERNENEGPQHWVTVPAFVMGRYPVTQAQWRVVAALPQVNRMLEADPSRFKGDMRPVEQVSWYEAVEFCQRLSAYTQRPYRLPTEAEWEYACRAGTQSPFYFGQTLTPELANYDGNYTYNNGPKGEDREETTPVDHFRIANAWGLCDMHGNVWEFCQDQLHKSYEGAPSDGSAWLIDNKDSARIIRGGSWDDSPRNCRSALRHDYLLDDSVYNVGFRVACSAP